MDLAVIGLGFLGIVVVIWNLILGMMIREVQDKLDSFADKMGYRWGASDYYKMWIPGWEKKKKGH